MGNAMLVLIVCSIASPTKCHKVDLLVEACNAGGQAAAAQWVGQRPGVFLREIRSCELGIEA